MDEGFAAYAGRGEGLMRKEQDLFTHFVLTCDYKASAAAANYVMYG